MKCSEAQKYMRPYLEHALQDRDMALFLDHVENCRDCREELGLSLAVFGTGAFFEEGARAAGDNYPLRVTQMIERDRKMLRKSRIEHITSIVLMGIVLVILGAALYVSIFGVPWRDAPGTDTPGTEQAVDTEGYTEESINPEPSS